MLLATIVSGVSLGFLYGLVALTLILLVRSTGVLNFAAADVGMLSAFVAFAAIAQAGLPVPAALVLTGCFAILFGVFVYCSFILVRPGDALMLSLRTLALFILVRAVAYKIWGANSPYTFPRLIPEGGIAVFGLNVSFTQLLVIALALAVALAVGWLTSATKIGLMLRAVSSDRDTAADLGVPVIRVDLVA